MYGLLLGGMLCCAFSAQANTPEDTTHASCAGHEVLARVSKLSHEASSQRYVFTVLESRSNYFVDSGSFSAQEAHLPVHQRILQANFSDVFCCERPSDFLEIQGQAR